MEMAELTLDPTKLLFFEIEFACCRPTCIVAADMNAAAAGELKQEILATLAACEVSFTEKQLDADVDIAGWFKMVCDKGE